MKVLIALITFTLLLAVKGDEQVKNATQQYGSSLTAKLQAGINNIKEDRKEALEEHNPSTRIHRYFPSDGKNVTWSDANTNCRYYHGGHLVSIDTLQEQDDVMESIRNYRFSTSCKWGYWVDGKRFDRLRIWEWTNSRAPILDQLWNSAHPKKDSSCAIWYPPSDSMVSKPCSYNYCYICEIE